MALDRKGTVELVVVTDGFTGGLHFGGQVGIQTGDLVEGEYGDLHVPALLLGCNACAQALILQALAQSDLGGDVGHLDAGDLGDEGNSSGGTGVDLDDIDVLVLVNDELDVEQALDADAQTQTHGVIDDGILDLLADREGGIDRDRVAGMDTGALNMLHDTRDKYILAVADRINLKLDTHEIFVDQDRVFDIVGENDRHLLSDVIVCEGNNHVLTAEHV